MHIDFSIREEVSLLNCNLLIILFEIGLSQIQFLKNAAF